ncbi:MAG: PAS domain S-box protein [Isosphaeraceae bacterium]
MACHVLIVEDDPAHAEALRRRLSESRPSWRLQVVDSVRACRDALSKATPDIAIVDLNLPDGRSNSLLSWPPEDGAFPVIVMTSHGDETIAVAAMKAGALDYVVKSPEAFAAIPHTAERALREWHVRIGHRRAEEELRRSRERLLIAQEAAALGMYDLNLRSHSIEADGRFRELLGIEADGPIRYEEVLSRIHPDDRAMQESVVESALRATGGDRYALEYRVIRLLDGAVTWVAVTGRTVFENGQPVRLVGTVQSVTERKVAEGVLRQQLDLQGQLAKIAEAVPGAIYSFYMRPDGTSHLTYASPAFAEMSGLPGEGYSEDLAPYISNIHPEDRPRVVESLAAVVRDQSAWHEVYRYIHPTRGERWVESWSAPRTESDGRLLFHGFVTDVTERKQVEEALRDNEAHLKAVVTGAIDAIITIDAAGTVLSVNPAAERTFGYTADEVLGRDVSLLMPTPHRDGQDGFLARYFLTGERQVVGVGREIPARRKDGTIFPMEIGVSEIRVSGNVIYVGILRDITERRRAEVAVRSLNADLERRVAERTADVRKLVGILDASTDLIGICAPDGRPLWENEALRRFLGLTADKESRPESFSVLYTAESAERVRTEGVDVAAREGHWLGESFLTSFDGRIVPASQLILAHRGADGTIEFYSTILRDISERIQMEASLRTQSQELLAANAELARANRLKDEFLASMSHELRTPLNAVLGFSQSLVEGAYGAISPQQARVIGHIERSGRHLLGLINDILDLSKIEAGELKLNPSRMSVTAVCQAGLRMVRQAALAKRLNIVMNADETIGPVLADELRLKQVLVNLLSNAVKFTPEGGDVSLAVKGDRAAGTITFAVRDTGIGIRAEDMDILFQPFRQIDSRLSRQYAGTGLGLALVRKLAALHGGSVSVESEPGQGSQFSVTIPWVCETDEEKPASNPLTPGPANGRPSSVDTPADARATGRDAAAEAPLLLLAEDDEESGSLTTEVLEAAGYRVARARDGAEAVRVALELGPRIVLMDIQMPGTDGLEAMRLLRSRPETREIPVVALTALAMVGDRERCLEAGASAYLSKPFKLSELRQVVGEILGSNVPAVGTPHTT